jgi:hypothetical protein
MTEHASFRFVEALDIFTIEDTIIPPIYNCGCRYLTCNSTRLLWTATVPFGISLKNHICAFPGVIDCDFRGEIKVLLQNFGNYSVEIKRGTRVAELIILSYKPVEEFLKKQLSSTQESATGFGSSVLNILSFYIFL